MDVVDLQVSGLCPWFQGWEHYGAVGDDINLWLDDVVVSRERAGCPVQ